MSKRNRQLPCIMEVKLLRNTCFSEKTSLKCFCLSGSYYSIYENKSKCRKYIQDAEHFAEELQKYPCLYEKGETRRKMLGEQLSSF